MIKNPFAGMSTRTKVFTAITLAVIIVVIVGNLLLFSLGVNHTAYIDLTPEGLYTVRDKMFDVCRGIMYMPDGVTLREPGITMTFCADPDLLIGSDVMRPIYHMALALSEEFSNFEVKTVNVLYHPTEVADYKTTSLTQINQTDVIVAYGDRYSIVPANKFWQTANKQYYSFDGEYRLASVMLSLTLINRPVAYFLTDHDTDVYDFVNIDNTDNSKVGAMIDLLRERGMAVQNISFAEIYEAARQNGTEPKIPDDCVLFIINNPKEDFEYDESQAANFSYVSETEIVDRYLLDGRGSVMVAKDYKVSCPNFEALLFEWGIQYSDTLVKDDKQYIQGAGLDYTTVVSEYNKNENSYAYEICGEYASLDSAPRTIISDTGHIICSFGESSSAGEAGSLNTSRVFAPFLYTSEHAQDFAKSEDSDGSIPEHYVHPASNKGQKVLAAIAGRQTINDVTAEMEFSYIFCAASGDFFSTDLLGNTSYANADIVSAAVQSIARLETSAAMELGGVSNNNYQNFGGKVLVSTALSETEKNIYVYDAKGVPTVEKVNRAFPKSQRFTYLAIVMALPLAIAVVGIVVNVKRKYL